MTIVDQIKEDKEALRVEIQRLIQEFEDKHQIVKVGDIKVGIVGVMGPFYNKVRISFPCTVEGIS